jgi:hypothetical protein
MGSDNLTGPFQFGGKLPFDKLRANEKACPFALSLSKGEFAPNLNYAHIGQANRLSFPNAL